MGVCLRPAEDEVSWCCSSPLPCCYASCPTPDEGLLATPELHTDYNGGNYDGSNNDGGNNVEGNNVEGNNVEGNNGGFNNGGVNNGAGNNGGDNCEEGNSGGVDNER